MRDHLEDFGDATIVVVTFAEPDRLAAYRTHLHLPFPVLSDIDRRLYRLAGAERGTLRQVWSVATLRMYGTLIRSGRRLHRPTEDIRQLGADIVVDSSGIVRYIALPASPDQRPSISHLIDALGSSAAG